MKNSTNQTKRLVIFLPAKVSDAIRERYRRDLNTVPNGGVKDSKFTELLFNEIARGYTLCDGSNIAEDNIRFDPDKVGRQVLRNDQTTFYINKATEIKNSLLLNSYCTVLSHWAMIGLGLKAPCK